MHPRKVSSVIVLSVSLLATSIGYGQTGETGGGWTSLSFTGGLSSGSSDTGVAVGGTFIFELTPRLALEAAGQYLDRGSGADAFDLSGNLLVSLVPSDRKLVPYVTAGGGVYRASYDLNHRRFLGPMVSEFGPGANIWPGMMGAGPGFFGGPSFDDMPFPEDMPYGDFFGQMPHFYGNRLGNLVVPGNGLLGNRSFTDPALNFGGGVRVDVGRHIFIRPDARVLVALAEGDTYSLGVFTLHIGYRF
ncbi:MAG TPA: hypothetical protein VEK15_15090 [Vicinamibacteria bacterium]|nr:hypothetical protein [Vicinamibacteria bacterium]